MAMDGAGEILKSDSNNPFNFNDSLLSLLECPVCTEYMRSPIKLCINGHALCSACKQKVSKCPTCQGQFLDTRNLSLENLAEKMQYPCENVLVGCNRRLAYTEVSEHRRTCVHRLYECLPGWSEGCKWMGRRSEILAHIETEHGHLVWSEKDNTWSHKMFDFSTTKNFLRVINVNKDIFWFQGRLNADAKKYYIAVQYIGPVGNRLNFTYRVEISSKCKNYGYIFKSVTLSDIEDFNDIFDSEVCAVINYGVMEVFLR